jgi:two-component system response regulator FixJ
MERRIIQLLSDLRQNVATVRASITRLQQKIADLEARRRALATARQSVERSWRRDQRLEALRLLATLSPRQRDVLQRIMAGQPNKVMAFELGLSEKTVETHRARLMQKLQANTLPRAIETALLGGLTEWIPRGAPN